jgi:hypothetical protein
MNAVNAAAIGPSIAAAMWRRARRRFGGVTAISVHIFF